MFDGERELLVSVSFPVSVSRCRRPPSFGVAAFPEKLVGAHTYGKAAETRILFDCFWRTGSSPRLVSLSKDDWMETIKYKPEKEKKPKKRK